MKITKASIILICSIFLTGCHNMCQDLETTIGKEWWYDKLEWIDYSKKTDYGFNSVTDFSCSSDGIITAKSTGNIIRNYVLTGSTRDVKGFIADIKLTSDANFAGFQIFSVKSYQRYEIRITKDGVFQFIHTLGTENSPQEILFSQKNAVTNILTYNNVKVVLNDDRSTSAYLNGRLMCKIPDHKIPYGQFAIATNTKTRDGTAHINAYYKIYKVLH